MLGGIRTLFRGGLSPQQTVQLAKLQLECASRAVDASVAMELCENAESALKKSAKRARQTSDVKEIGAVYKDIGKLQDRLGHHDKALANYKLAEKFEFTANAKSEQSPQIQETSSVQDLYPGERHFAKARSVFKFQPPGQGEKFDSTHQLAICLFLLQADPSPDEILDLATQQWLELIQNDTDGQEELHAMATEAIRVFARDETKDPKAITEVIYLAPVISADNFRYLLRQFYMEIDRSESSDLYNLEGLAQLIKGAGPGYLYADDLVKFLMLFSKCAGRLQQHSQSALRVRQFAVIISHVLDALADASIRGIDRQTLHEPFEGYLDSLKMSSDPFLVYQAVYAYQALLNLPDEETLWQAFSGRRRWIQGVSGILSPVKEYDFDGFINGLKDIQEGLSGVVLGGFTSPRSGESRDFVEGLREGLGFQRKCSWYPALRMTHVLLQDGQFSKFQTFVYEAPCRLDPAFQWGVCQQLGELAANPTWDANARQGAIAFLGGIYRDERLWGRHMSIKRWILGILVQLAASTGSDQKLCATNAKALSLELKAYGDSDTQDMYQEYLRGGYPDYPLRFSMPEPASPSLLDRVQYNSDIESNIRLLRKACVKERGSPIYVITQAKTNLQDPDTARFSLIENVREFLNGDGQVFLILGNSGAGKSTFMRELEVQLWYSYRKNTGRIPLYVNLAAIDRPEHDLIDKLLRKSGFTEPQIRELKSHRRFVLICDGYDESQQTNNLYVSNQLNQPGEWDAKMIISCRYEYLGVDYQDRFQPGYNGRSDPSLFQEAIITPFSTDQVQEYIKQYLSLNQPQLPEENYEQVLEVIPSLMKLVQNPFLTVLFAEVLPSMMGSDQSLSTSSITAVTLCDTFVKQWLERGLGRQAKVMSADADKRFIEKATNFMKNLSVSIYDEQDGYPVVNYVEEFDDKTWKSRFCGPDDEQKVLRDICPLTSRDNQLQFLNRPLLEYSLALAVYDPEANRSMGASTSSARRGTMKSTYGHELSGSSEAAGQVEQQFVDPTSPLVTRSFVNESQIIQFLSERAQQELGFKQQLLAYIEHSKTDKKWCRAAANAITILIKAGVDFIGQDLRGIRIPGADLSYGMFDSAELRSADLRMTKMNNIWLRRADLSRSQMGGVQFGDPALIETSEVTSCAYSPDGTILAVGLKNGNISLCTASTLEKIRTMSGHRDSVCRVAFSTRGDQVASASQDRTVRLWDIKTGLCQHILSGHVDCVSSIAYSPRTLQLASVGADKSLRLWNVTTGYCDRIINGIHSEEVLCLAYLPRGDWIVTGGADHMVKLWDLETGDCISTYSGHSGRVRDVAFSPHGDQIASASDDGTIRLWGIQTSDANILTGHGAGVTSVAYSPNGSQVASGSVDMTVRLWDTESGDWRHTLQGHTEAVTSVLFTPKGDQVISGSFDKTVRLRYASLEVSRLVSSRHGEGIASISCSPKADQIVSGGTDGKIRLWNMETGACRQTLEGHTATVSSIVFSPQGNQIVSGSADNSLRLWDAETGKQQHTITQDSKVLGVTFSPQGHLIASVGEDMTVSIWDVDTKKCATVMKGHTKEVTSVVYSPDSSRIASGSVDGTIRLWDVEIESCEILRGHEGAIKSLAYSRRGDSIVSGGQDKTVRLWDVRTGQCVHVMRGHTESVTNVTFHLQSDRIVASASEDCTVRLWDVDSEVCRAVIGGFQSQINDIDWNTPYLIAGCSDGLLYKWKVMGGEDQCRAQLCWRSADTGVVTTGLVATEATIQGVHGLSEHNKLFLKQQGAIDEPTQHS